MPRSPQKIEPRLNRLLLGAHLSIAGGLHNAPYRARDLSCTVLQIFTKNASTWKERVLPQEEIVSFKKAIDDTGTCCVAAHAAYLINLASPDRLKRKLSVAALSHEMKRSSQLGIPNVVIHPGAHMGSGEAEGIRRIADNINAVFAGLTTEHTRLLLETTAGQGSSLGHRFEHLAKIISKVSTKQLVGVCLDTSHLFAAGYDIRSEAAYLRTMSQFEDTIGWQKLHLLHLNDSKSNLRSRVDRHDHIGRGAIGITAFALIMNDRRLDSVPKVIETPKKNDRQWDRINLKRLRDLIHRKQPREW